MGSVPTTPQSRTEQILDIIRELVPEDPAEPYPDLAEVDGNFYWRACREDFVSDTHSMLDLLREEEEPALAADQRERFDAYFERWEPEIPGLRAMMYRGELRFRLRDTRFWTGNHRTDCHPLHGRALSAEPGVEHWVSAYVFSPGVKGEEIEGHFRRLALGDLEDDKPQTEFDDPNLPAGTELIKVSVRFLGAGAGTLGPSIEITARLPLPPEGLVAEIFDRVVAKNGWRDRLVELTGVANGQEPRTAIRTWATGLLTMAGVPYQKACEMVLDALGDVRPYLERSQFYADRNLLLSRVPQATKYLSSSGRQ